MMELNQIKNQLNSSDPKECLIAIKSAIDAASGGIALLREFYQERRAKNIPIDFMDGTIYQTLLKMNDCSLSDQIKQEVNLRDTTIDCFGLFDLLTRSEYQQADALTNKKLCEASCTSAIDRGWLYFTDVDRISLNDIQTIDRLWVIFSEGKFGYSVQRRIWLNSGKNWEKLWQQIQWKKDGSFTRYPVGFIWNLDAPRGHLPLSNQIRGNKTLEAIFNLLGKIN